MSEHITILTVVAISVSLILVIWATYTWLAYFHQLVRYRSLGEETESLYSALKGVSTREEYLRSLTRIQRMSLSDDSAWFVALKWAVGRRLTREECRQYMMGAIQTHYRPLSRQIDLVKGVAPSMGLLFTVLGLMMVMFKQSLGLDRMQMLGDIGTALITTGVSSFVLILQVTLLSLLSSLMDREYGIGMSMIDCLLDGKNALAGRVGS